MGSELSRLARASCIAGFAFLAVTCGGKETLSGIVLPPSTRISTEGRFALVNDPYVSLRDIPGASGIAVAHARRGDVLSVKGKKLVTDADGSTAVLWLDLGTGWVVESSVRLYSNESRAMNAARLIEADSQPTR